MKNLLGGVAAALLCMLPLACNADYVPRRAVQEKPAAQRQEAVIGAGLANYNAAYEAYRNAKNAADSIPRANYYASAISNAARANALEPGNIHYIVLSSQIYRGKGVLPYAKSYFFKAEKLLRQELEQYPDDVWANLNYAALCFAGDIRYWPEGAAYREKAEQYAERARKLAAESGNLGGSDALRAQALAELVLGRRDECGRLLRSAAELDMSRHGSVNRIYSALYDATVEQHTWLWPVAEENLTAEFLLYYLGDFSNGI